jgi:hypothetical protein
VPDYLSLCKTSIRVGMETFEHRVAPHIQETLKQVMG